MDRPDGSWEGAPPPAWRDRWDVPDVLAFGRTTSTNDIARRLAESGAAAGTVVVADEQTDGRGRLGRRWIAPPARALLLSVVLRPQSRQTFTLPSTAPIRVGLAAARAIAAVTGIDAALKWPNDIVVHRAGKLAGILCEAGTAGGTSWVVAGIGINNTQTADDFSPELRGVATSILQLTGEAANRGALAGALIEALRPFSIGDLQPLTSAELEAYARRDALLGSDAVADGVTGTACGLEPDGALRLATPAGLRLVRTGSVGRSESSGPGVPSNP